MRRPQRPGNQSCAEAPTGGTLPPIHPRELPGTASSAAMLWQGIQNISLNVSTVRLARSSHQGKSRALLCRSCEWRRFLVESAGKIRRNRISRSNFAIVNRARLSVMCQLCAAFGVVCQCRERRRTLCRSFYLESAVVGDGWNYRWACGLCAGFLPGATAFFRTFTSKSTGTCFGG